MIDVGPHLFWITSRAAGTGAIVLANLSVLVGLLIGAKAMSGPRTRHRSSGGP